MVRHRTFITLVLLAFFSCSLPSYGQGDPGNPNRITQQADISPLEVIRNIDQLLGATKIEATQAGRGKAFTDKVNMAKSFVHADKVEEAKKAYREAVDIAWNRGEQEDLVGAIDQELSQLVDAVSSDTRPEGLDESYQPTSAAAKPIPIDKYAAGDKIDAMLEFLYTEILKDPEKQLTLKGQLADSRHLVEMELFTEAKESYHNAIIQYLDPRWTSQLLGDINGVLTQVEPTKLDVELNPNVELSEKRAWTEIETLLEPLQRRYASNSVYKHGMDSLRQHLVSGNRDAMMDQFRSTTLQFAPKVWVDHSSMRLQSIMQHTPSLQGEKRSTVGTAPSDLPPILYFTDQMEGRTVERLRILEDNELKTYKKVTHNWGGVFYFVGDDPTKDTEWLRIWRLYQSQQ